MAGKVLRDYLEEAKHFLTAAPQRGVLELKASDAQRAAMALNVGIPQYEPRAYRVLLDRYRLNPIVRRATKLCAEAVASIEPVIKVEGEEESDAAEYVRQWMKRPNPAQDGFSFRSALASFFKLSGNGWVEGVAGATSRYYEGYVLRPERMHVIPGENGFPAGYEFDPGNGRKIRWRADFEREQSRLLHIKDFSADNDYFGAGALEAAEASLSLYEQAQNLARYMFQNGLVTSGMMTYEPQVPAGQSPPKLTEEQKSMMEKALEAFKLNKKSAGKVLMLPAAFKYTPLSTTMVDLQAEEIRNQAKRDIALAFGVPPMLLGIPGDNTYANFQEASRAFYRNTVIPDSKRILEAMARWCGQLMGVRDISFEIDEDDLWPLAEELAMRASRVEGSQVLSYQEKREAIGYDPEPPPGQMPSFMNELASMLQADLGPPKQARVIPDASQR